MKWCWVWLTVLALLATLCGCQERGNPNVYDVVYNGRTYTVDQAQGTMICDGVVYQFQGSAGSGSSVNVEITYPDGSRYYWTQEGTFSHSGWSEDYNPEAKGYVPGDVLFSVLNFGRTSSSRSGSPLMGIFLLALGGLLAAAPRAVWMVEYGWRFKSVEPSDLALGVHRGTGVILLIVGATYLLVSLL